MFCARCAGSGKIMGNGLVFIDCTQCVGKGHYEPAPIAITTTAEPVTPIPHIPHTIPHKDHKAHKEPIPTVEPIPFQDLIAKVPICPRINKVDKRSRMYRAAVEEIMDECDVSRKDAMIMFAKTYEQIRETSHAN